MSTSLTPNPIELIQKLIDAHKFLRLVWSNDEVRTKFSEAWSSFTPEQRRAIAKQIAPNCPESKENPWVVIDGERVDMSGFAAMFPDLLPVNLIKDGTLFAMFETLVSPGTFSQAAFDQMCLLRAGIMNGSIKFARDNNPSSLVVIYIDQDFGRVVQLCPETDPNHETANKEILEMKQKGYAVEQWEFEMLKTRMRFLIEHCVMLFHTVKAVALLKPDIQTGCWKCGKKACDDGSKLMACVKCGDARYCSRVCQVDDWKNGHKQKCASKVSAGVSA
ncbi:hypothetical protein HDU98_011244 [Podochytrium sp. JEL0797]|nr:hypothetical protein HDU98_011244 [Podochytrium sp. JEL0797]